MMTTARIRHAITVQGPGRRRAATIKLTMTAAITASVTRCSIPSSFAIVASFLLSSPQGSPKCVSKTVSSRGPGKNLTPDSKPVLSLPPEDGGMNKTRSLIFGSVVVASMIFGGVVSATVFAKTSLPFNVNAAAPSPSPFKSNEATAHESGESAAEETAENNGTFHPGPGGTGGGPSNET